MANNNITTVKNVRRLSTCSNIVSCISNEWNFFQKRYRLSRCRTLSLCVHIIMHYYVYR